MKLKEVVGPVYSLSYIKGVFAFIIFKEDPKKEPDEWFWIELDKPHRWGYKTGTIESVVAEIEEKVAEDNE